MVSLARQMAQMRADGRAGSPIYATLAGRYASLSASLGGDAPGPQLDTAPVDGRGDAPQGSLGTTPPPPPSCALNTVSNFNNTPVAIPSTTPPNVVSSTINIAGADAFLWDLNLQTFITHTFAADLDITLQSPAGTIVTVTTDNGGSNDNVFNGTIWDDEANPGGQVPYTTNNGLATDNLYANLTVATPLAPEEAFDAFYGEDPNGTWTLTISDDAGGDGGSLDSWQIEIVTLASAPTDDPAANFSQNTPVAIPATTPPTVVSSTIGVAGLTNPICGMTLTTAITHTFAADLDITLQSPTGTIVTVTTDNGGSNDNVFNGTFWDDQANPSGQVPYTNNNGLANDQLYANLTLASPLVGEEALGAFRGEDPNGIWTLTISDDAGGDGGSLDSWGLSFTSCSCAGAGNCGENFDGVTAPALPAGWTTSFVNGAGNCTPTGTCTQGTNWATSTTTPDTAPNDAFHNDPSCVTDSLLDSPVFNPTAGAQLTFRNFYNTESTFDGGVLEISINGGPYQDILAAGGSFAVGGYNGTISVNFLSPIAGRQAWTGNSSGYVTTTVNLPPAAIGQPVTFRFRMASDCSVSSTGWRVDTIAMTPCGGGGGCVITPPADITVSNDAGQCGAVVNYPAPTTSGQCGPITCTPPSGSSFPVGTTTVTCSDVTGASANFDITVNDTELPTVVAPDLVVGNDAGLCSAVVNFNATASDNCPGVGAASCVPPSGSVFLVGVTPVTCSATDAAGNIGNDAGSIAVNDVEPPVITCPADIELDLPPGSTGQNVDYDPPTVSDNCGVIYDCQPPSGVVFPAGQTPVTCTANDPASNSAQCTFLITLGAVTVLEVPALSSLGLLALALLLAAAAFVALRRNG